jgi:hypothetical protein
MLQSLKHPPHVTIDNRQLILASRNYSHSQQRSGNYAKMHLYRQMRKHNIFKFSFSPKRDVVSLHRKKIISSHVGVLNRTKSVRKWPNPHLNSVKIKTANSSKLAEFRSITKMFTPKNTNQRIYIFFGVTVSVICRTVDEL